RDTLHALAGSGLGGRGPAAPVLFGGGAMTRPFSARARSLGDPAGAPPPAYLTEKRFAASVRAKISPDRAASAESFGPLVAPPREGDNTTHFSVVDRFGNAVANTTTLNFSYGVGLVAEGTGVLLNNELDA